MDNIQQTILSKLTSTIQAPMRLRDLIRQIRASRTAADERSVVQRECAYIRSTFRQEDNVWRCRNVVKLLYIHMLGYPAHFGQLECLKLIASPRFTDKRIGYLGAMLLLDEKQEVHLLITNSLKSDLNSSEQFISGLAICALGAICSPELARDLADEVERLMRSSSAYIKKKAIICAARMVRKAPELLDTFLSATTGLLNERNHGVLIASIILMTEMCERSQDALVYFRKFIPQLTRLLKSLMMSGNSPDHDVCCISDPFLQVKILKLLRILARNHLDSSEQITDSLVSISTNTESSKNVGNAILYEAVLTMMEVHPDTGIRELAINTLGRFLLNMDKNIRYVALETFLKTTHTDYSYVQRHRATILECLKDMDISIQKKAMELSFFLINNVNFHSVTTELISFLDRADVDLKAICASNLCICVEKFATEPKCQIDTMIKVLTTSGNYVRDDIVGNVCQLISANSSLHSYCVRKLWFKLKRKDLCSVQPLVQISMWSFGEYGDLINQTSSDKTSTNQTENQDEFSVLADLTSQLPNEKPSRDIFDEFDDFSIIADSKIDDSISIESSRDGELDEEANDEEDEDKESELIKSEDIVLRCEEVLNDPLMSITTKEYAMNALFKLSVRFPENSVKVKLLADNSTTNLNLEIQQRSIEFTSLFSKHENLLPTVFEKMPMIEKNQIDQESDNIKDES